MRRRRRRAGQLRGAFLVASGALGAGALDFPLLEALILRVLRVVGDALEKRDELADVGVARLG